MKNLAVLSIFFIVTGICCPHYLAQELHTEQVAPATPNAAMQEVATQEQPDLALMMSLLKPDTIVLQVGSMALRWQELQPQIKRLFQTRKNSSADRTEKALRTYLQRIALRGLYLQEANASNFQITDADRKANDEQLVKGLQTKAKGVSVDEFKKSFAKDKSTLLALTEEDSQRVVTLGNQMMADITVSEEEVDLQLTATKAIHNSLRQQNQQIRAKILQLIKDPDSQTNEGFARLARDFSEGTEADNGGVMDYDFLRSELAEINHLEQFDLKPGQTSGLLETPTAFRVMRVLSAVPPKKDDEPERIRVAQWLFTKLPEDEVGSRERVREKLLLSKQKEAIAAFGETLQKKHPVSSIFFPNGLWEQPGQNK